MGFGRALRKLRADADLTQQELAQRSDIHPSQISEIENGKGNPRWASARRIAAALGVGLDELADQAEYFDRRLQEGSPIGRAGFAASQAPPQVAIGRDVHAPTLTRVSAWIATSPSCAG